MPFHTTWHGQRLVVCYVENPWQLDNCKITQNYVFLFSNTLFLATKPTTMPGRGKRPVKDVIIGGEKGRQGQTDGGANAKAA